VRDLPDILANPDALKSLEKHDVVKANAVLQAENPSLTSNLYAAIDRAAEELESIALNELRALQDGDKPRVEKLQRLKRRSRVWTSM